MRDSGNVGVGKFCRVERVIKPGHLRVLLLLIAFI